MNDYSYIVPEIIALDGKQTQYHEVAELVIGFDGNVALETRTKFSGDNSSTFVRLYGVELAYPLGYGPAAIDVARLRRDMSADGSIAVLIDRIITGFDRKCVGSNWRGTMTEDAAEASDELTALAADDAYVNDEVCVENVGDTVFRVEQDGGLTDSTTDEELDELAEDYKSEDAYFHVITGGDLLTALTKRRNELAADAIHDRGVSA